MPWTEEEEGEQLWPTPAVRGARAQGLGKHHVSISKIPRMFLGLFSVWVPFLLEPQTRLSVRLQAQKY